jgi:hypothetical protein
MKPATFVLFQALVLGALAVPAPAPAPIPAQNKDTPKFDWHKGMTRDQEGRKYNV